MAWSYNETDISTSSASGRLNAVRLLVGDTNEDDQLIKDEEITFALAQSNDNIYYSAAWCATTISAQFARRVNTSLDGALSADYSNLSKQFKALSLDLREQGQKYSMSSASIRAGGISNAAVDAAQALTDRPSASFSKGQFDNPPNSSQYIQDYD